MGRKNNPDSVSADGISEKGVGSPLSWTEHTVQDKTASAKGIRSRKESRSVGPDPEYLLDLAVALSSAGSVRELASVLSRSLHPMLPYDIGCIRWAPADLEDKEWSIDTSGDDLTESLSFDHMGGMIEEWEGRDPTINFDRVYDGPDDDFQSEVFRFRMPDGDLVSLRIRSLVVIPLNFGDRMVGVLTLMSSRGEAFRTNAISEMDRVWTITACRLYDLLDREAISSDRDRARTLLDSSEDLLAIWRYDGSVWEVDCNRRTEELMDRNGMGPDRMDGPFFIPPGPDLERADAAWKRTFSRGEASRVDIQLPGGPGKMRTYMFEFTPLLRDMSTIGVIMTGMDMERLSSSIGSVEGENRANRLLLSVLSNDLKDPLCALFGYSELLRERTPLSSEQDRYLGKMTGMVSRMNGTIDLANLLFRLREGKISLDLERMDLSRMVQRCLDLLHPRTQYYDVVFQRKDSEIEATCSKLIEQVVINIVDNAMRFSKAGSRIVLDLSTDIEGITFSVGDEGEGVPERYRSTIFERFDGTHLDDGVQGSGIGLAISKGIILLHKGRIWVEDNRPKGSVFKFFLPWDPEA
ncbi:MAG: ATP-binding protein [Candidatus Thermoplasmatota archaeon]|jgi:signal transduction histidine kinase|nr:ATP-binding protein [Candidatus Thermoplasmatota archaeon]